MLTYRKILLFKGVDFMKKWFMMLFSFVVLLFTGCSKKPASIGIIGGADGPTAILITGSKTWFFICSIIALIFIIVLIYFIIRKGRR